MLDTLLVSLSAVCSQLLPIIGAAALVYLCVFLKNTIKFMQSLTKTVESLEPTIKLTNQSIEKAQAPLDTVVNLSHSVDGLAEKTKDSAEKVGAFVNENMDKVKDYVTEKVTKVKDLELTNPLNGIVVEPAESTEE